MDPCIKTISVIVPIYKVEPYLRRCLDSIINQTYPHLEVILVEDGSPDRCGEICDEYASRDSRIRVIHQENAGLSAARNAALDIATGDYVGFVDSDDYIAAHMYERLMSEISIHSADIAYCNYYEIRNNRPVYNIFTVDPSLSTTELKTAMICGNGPCCVWCRLYNSSLFDNLRFPVGQKYEDFLVMPDIYTRARKITGIEDRLYFYNRDNDESITSLTSYRFDYQYDEFAVYVERIQKYHLDSESFLFNLILPTVRKGLTLLTENALTPCLKNEQLDVIKQFLLEQEHLIAKKYRFRWFCYKYCQYLFNFYVRYRASRIRKRQLLESKDK